MNPLAEQFNIRKRPADYLPDDVIARIRSGWRGDVIVIFPGTVDLLPFQQAYLRGAGIDVPSDGKIIIKQREVRCVDRGAAVPHVELTRAGGLWVRVEVDDFLAGNLSPVE